MSIGLILLIAVAILTLFGVTQRVLDKLRLTDRQALLFALLLFIGGLVPEIPLGPYLSVNVGGALVPLGLSIYLLARAETGKEVARALIASIITGAVIYLMGKLLPNEPEDTLFDPNYLYGLAAGAIAYVCGRSRRASFIAGTLGVILSDFASAIEVWMAGVAQPLALGGAGAFDVIVIAALTAVLLAELVGELIERGTRVKEGGAK